ncbi:MAG: cellulase family glycosylhydrolase [Saprospiraceae bacterium]|nr:cellulase family glycosylhydrolase [Saprospiraceae bacterium]
MPPNSTIKLMYRLSILCLFIGVQSLIAQNTPFNRGVNLTGWFQANSAQGIQFSKYTKQDFEQIQSLGCDVVRLPVNLHYMTNGAPNYTLDPLFLNFLDEVADWAEELNLHLIFDNHTFDPAADTDPAVGNILEKVWLQMAQHFKNRSDLIYYEILNEPHGISDALWNAIQQDVVQTIRTVDNTHWIIVGGAGWNSYYNLDDMPVYSDDKLIYTFHFYDPFLFTHQGASWVTPSLVPLADMPFPYNAAGMPSMPPSFAGTWVGDAFNNYANDGTVARVQQLLNIAVQFREQRQVPIYCGEMGVFMPNSDNDDRVFWYEVVREYLENNGISWTMWDYHGGFGLFEAGSDGLFDHDLNVPMLEALGFNIPPQSPFVTTPDSTGFPIYTDYIGAKIYESSYNNGSLLFYSQDLPNNGDYCIRWTGADQYNNIGFDFRPDKDLTYLLSEGYALDFLVRGNTPGLEFDMRFIDTDTDSPNDHPWRMRVTIDETYAPWDGHWHHIHIPLADFTEHGAWEDDTWYNPQGDFDWAAVDRFEIVAEHSPLQNAGFWFDNIQVTDLDTAQVFETGVLETASPTAILPQLSIFPNPAGDFVRVKADIQREMDWQLSDLLGRIVRKGVFKQSILIDLSDLSAGSYFFTCTDKAGKSGVKKLVKY